MSYLSRYRACVLVACGAATLTTACGEPPPPPKMASSSSSSEGFASCPRDTIVVGGGYEVEAHVRASGRAPTVVSNRPTETGWKVECIDADGKTVAGCRAYVLCATLH